MIVVDLLAALLWGFSCAIIGVVYASVLASDDTPLNSWFRLLEKNKERGGWRAWIASPMGGCQNCFSGQLALWTSTAILPTVFYWEWRGGWLPALVDVSWSSVFMHFLSAGAAVLCAHFLNWIYRWTTNHLP